ncbi:aspartate aminotransferase family protein [Frisingicoccus sp.]|uniref:aspartate aminotransferase family protein n=1 Tax=Frisingicoccus sp. TaxID=1918627 RepID=UPI002E78F19E|nr:aspartate aminotransferase family protein [Frisingicoccus sp.]MEE0753240.1 aspartate aminotransferase family protein [Frisingicoccus sp.]
MVTNEFKNYAEAAIIHTYNRFPVAFDHGDGVYLYDTDGRRYLDFAAGIAVNAFGYNVEEYKDALKAQIDKLMHVSNLYYTEPMAKAAHKLAEASGLKRVFFTNSGTEAIEGAIKVARKYAFKKDGTTDHEIIAMEHSFHGRSMGALSVTGNAHYREAFQPGIGNIVFAEYNNLEDVKSKITDKTCAILFETVQGEGGIYPGEKEFIQEIRKICDEKDILLILDEIQCGMGRTGKMFAYQHYGILPDVMTSAKALGCGVPVGAFVVGEKAENALEPGDHGSTYGGNPFVTAAVCKVFEMFESRGVLENVNEVSAYLDEKLQALVKKYDVVKATRGLGLMRALEMNVPVGPYVNKALEKGLLIISAGTHIIRFVPPLVITKDNVDEMIGILDECLGEIE